MISSNNIIYQQKVVFKKYLFLTYTTNICYIYHNTFPLLCNRYCMNDINLCIKDLKIPFIEVLLRNSIEKNNIN